MDLSSSTRRRPTFHRSTEYRTMSSVAQQSRSAEGRGSDLLDGRGGSNRVNAPSFKKRNISENAQADTAKAPRYCAFFYPWPSIRLSYLHG